MDIITAMGIGTKAIETLKAIKDIDKSYDAATWKMKVAELMSDVSEMKMALHDAREELQTLEDEKNKLEDFIKFKVEKTIYKNGLLYEVYDDGKEAEFPFCQKCTSDGKFMRLIRVTIGHTVKCPNCKNDYATRTVANWPKAE